MNFRLLKLGHIQIPQGIVSKYRRLIHTSGKEYGGVDQVPSQEEDCLALRHKLAKVFKINVPVGEPASVLSYRSVEIHNDDWDSLQDARKRLVAPGFLHVVLSGQCVVRSGTKIGHYSRGDVFLLNPNVLHEVPSKTHCMTYTEVVPAHEVWQAIR